MWGWSSPDSTNRAPDSDEHEIADSKLRLNTDPSKSATEKQLVDANGSIYADERDALLARRVRVMPHLRMLPWGAWTEDDLAGIQLRGKTYLDDKIKIDCGPPLYRLAHCDIFYTKQDEEKITHIASRPENYFQQMRAKRINYMKNLPQVMISNPHCSSCCEFIEWYDHPLNTTIVINIVFPVNNINMNCVQWYERRVPPFQILKLMQKHNNNSDPKVEYCCECLNGVDASRVAAFDRLLQQMNERDDEFRDSTLKIIPRVAEGGWVVRKGVGKTPAILGKKVKHTYFRDSEANYIEIDCDLSGSRIAGQIVGIVKSYCKTIVVDLSFVFQGDEEDTLPESIIGGVRVHKADMDEVMHFNTHIKQNKYNDL